MGNEVRKKQYFMSVVANNQSTEPTKEPVKKPNCEKKEKLKDEIQISKDNQASFEEGFGSMLVNKELLRKQKDYFWTWLKGNKNEF